MGSDDWSTIRVVIDNDGVCWLELNRPNKLNSMNRAFWKELRECVTSLSQNSAVKCIVVASSSTRIFSAGLDLQDLPFTQNEKTDTSAGVKEPKGDVGRKSLLLYQLVSEMQATFTALEKCRVPILAAVHGGCIGAGVDLITACDMRYCTTESFFSVKEVDLGLAADVGTLQRLPKVTGNASAVREWCFTGRKVDSQEALNAGLVSRVLGTREELHTFCLNLARQIAKKSPIAVLGTKRILVHSRDHSVPESLDYVALWNSVMLQSDDLEVATRAAISKIQPRFSKL